MARQTRAFHALTRPAAMLTGMAPQRRGLVPAEHLERIRALQSLRDDTEDQLHRAVADALKAGASVRELAEQTGISTTTVQKYGHEHGWPTDRQRAEWAAVKHDRDEFRARLDTAMGVLSSLELDDDE